MTDLVEPHTSVTVEYIQYIDGELKPKEEVTVELGERGGRAFLGVTYSLSGFSFTTPDAVLQAAKNPLHGADSISDAAYAALEYIGKPFRGHSPIQSEVMWWYDSSLMSNGALHVALQLIFWIFWLNLVLAITNALPMVPFDGGHLFRDGVGSLVDRTHKNATPERREGITNSVTRLVSYALFFILMLIMVAIVF
jgi:membrane-associated protease RseP (regulator of RpoE activity)